MNTKYYRKSYYKQKNIKFVLLYFLTFGFLMTNIVIMQCLRNTGIFKIGFIGIDLSILVFFLMRTILIKRNISNNHLELTDYSNRILKRHRIIMIVFVMLVMIHIECIIVNIVHEANHEIKTWIWYAMVLPALYSDSVYLSGITAFGDKMYASGEYLIDYSKIDHITDIYNKKTSFGDMVLMTLWKNQKYIGYDKMFLDEYIYFKNKVRNQG